MDADPYGPRHGDYRQLVQRAWEVLVREQALSIDEAHRYLCERARADSLFIIEVAGRILEARSAPPAEWPQESAASEADSGMSYPRP